MSPTLAQLEQQAQALSAEERARFVEILLESLRDTPAAEIEAEWEKEIADRVAAFDRGEVQTFAAEEVFADARLLALASRESLARRRQHLRAGGGA